MLKKYILIILGAGILVFFAFNFFSHEKSDLPKFTDDMRDNTFSQSPDCQEEKLTFEYPPVNLEETEVIVPLGLMSGGHVTPVDHQYFQDFNNTEPDIEVYSPGDGTVRFIEFMEGTRYEGGRAIDWADYRLNIEHSCRISSMYIHIDVLSDKLAQEAPKKRGTASVNIPIKAGEVIGWYQNNIDYNVVDTKVTLNGFLVPEHYQGEPWKIHVPDTFEYFTDNLVNTMIEKSLRSEEPYAGKLDWDIEGRLRGNWFEKGTNYYAGSEEGNYWSSHLSIAPDYLDHSHTIISIGDYNSSAEQFGIKGNPDPAEVSVESGLLKYELVHYEYYTVDGTRWDRMGFAKIKEARNQDSVLGTVLIQMLNDRELRFEVFAGKTANQVAGFTDNSKIYTR